MVPFENYESTKEKFSNYIERFENYLDVKNISDSQKRAQLLCASIGSEHYNNLSTLLGPEKTVKELDYKELIKSLREMLVPYRSTIVSQHYFLSIIQNEKQNITEFVASLRRSLAECNFYETCACQFKVSVSEIFLRAQFIRGLRDNWIREQLLLSDCTKFNDLVTKDTAFEAARIESRQLIEQSSMDATTSDSNDITNQAYQVNNNSEVRPFNKVNNLHHDESQHRFSRSLYPRNQRNFQPNRKSYINFRALGIDNLCFNCSKPNHTSKDCFTDREKLKCTFCGKIGHVSKVCITTLLQKHRTPQSSCSAKYISPERNTDHSYGINKLNYRQAQETVDLFDTTSDSDKYWITVKLNGKLQRFEVDSGAKFSLLAEDDFKNLNLNIPLQHTDITFRSYSDNTIKPLGKITILVSYKGRKVPEELFIVPHGYDALLGRGWIRSLGVELKELDREVQYNEGKQATSIFEIQSHDLLNNYASVFDERVGCVPNFEVNPKLRNNAAKPVYAYKRNFLYSLPERVGKLPKHIYYNHSQSISASDKVGEKNNDDKVNAKEEEPFHHFRHLEYRDHQTHLNRKQRSREYYNIL